MIKVEWVLLECMCLHVVPLKQRKRYDHQYDMVNNNRL